MSSPTSSKWLAPVVFCATALLLPSTASAIDGACPCVSDLDFDGITNASDLAILLGAWGTGTDGDLDGNGAVNGADLAILLGAWGPCAAPPNDNCPQAPMLSGESVTAPFCTISATDSPGSLPAFCEGEPFAMGKDVWFKYTAPYTGKAIILTGLTDFDTTLAVYGSNIAGACACPGGQFTFATLLACNDDSTSLHLESWLQIPITEDECYSIRVGGYKYAPNIVASGTGNLYILPVMTGDACDVPHDLPSLFHLEVLGDSLNDTFAVIDPSSCGLNDANDEWYRYVMPCQGTLTISTCDPVTDFDTTLSAFVGCEGVIDEIACNDDYNAPGCQIGRFNRKSRITFNANGGEVIYFRVSGYQSVSGHFKIILDADCTG
jgi:hypothetical protein